MTNVSIKVAALTTIFILLLTVVVHCSIYSDFHDAGTSHLNNTILHMGNSWETCKCFSRKFCGTAVHRACKYSQPIVEKWSTQIFLTLDLHLLKKYCVAAKLSPKMDSNIIMEFDC